MNVHVPNHNSVVTSVVSNLWVKVVRSSVELLKASSCPPVLVPGKANNKAVKASSKDKRRSQVVM